MKISGTLKKFQKKWSFNGGGSFWVFYIFGILMIWNVFISYSGLLKIECKNFSRGMKISGTLKKFRKKLVIQRGGSFWVFYIFGILMIWNVFISYSGLLKIDCKNFSRGMKISGTLKNFEKIGHSTGGVHFEFFTFSESSWSETYLYHTPGF